MINTLGRSVYLSSFETMKNDLKKINPGFIFTSLHIGEEFDENYTAKAKEMCNWLNENNFKIIADVSKKTLEQFRCDDVLDLSNELNLSVLRIDYGFTEDEIKRISNFMPIAVNASTPDNNIAKEIASMGNEVYAIHNFYPRPETGLDSDFFENINKRLNAENIKVLAFIQGDEHLRGPIFKGLPTLEMHRNIPPYAAYTDLIKNFSVDGVLVGDNGISQKQNNLIGEYINTGIISVPMVLHKNYKYLYNKIFTVRADSPAWIARFQESREYSCFGKTIEPENCIERKIGTVTIDNIGYKRYSGEIQLVKSDLPPNENINVIGEVQKEYLHLIKSTHNGQKLMPVEPIM